MPTKFSKVTTWRCGVFFCIFPSHTFCFTLPWRCLPLLALQAWALGFASSFCTTGLEVSSKSSWCCRQSIPVPSSQWPVHHSVHSGVFSLLCMLSVLSKCHFHVHKSSPYRCCVFTPRAWISCFPCLITNPLLQVPGNSASWQSLLDYFTPSTVMESPLYAEIIIILS